MEENDPATHGLHSSELLAPTQVENVPAMHPVHVALLAAAVAVENVPDEQLMHADAPEECTYEPAEQGKQDCMLEAARAVAKVPATQDSH